MDYDVTQKHLMDANIQVLLGDRIRTYRIERGYSQEALADSLGISCRSLQRHEQGKGEMNLRFLGEVMNLFELELHQLIPDPRYYKMSRLVDEFISVLDTIQQQEIEHASQLSANRNRMWQLCHDIKELRKN